MATTGATLQDVATAELNFTPNALIRSLQRGRTSVIGVCAWATRTNAVQDITLLLGSTFGSLVIQLLSSPCTVSAGQTTIAVRHQSWESGVIEAPETLWHNGRLNILYSLGGYNQANYAEGALHFNGGDPTNAGSYTKLAGPLFTGNPSAWGQ